MILNLFFVPKLKNVSLKFVALIKSLYLCGRNFETGALVQLVRIHACHAWGHGFESRTHRWKRVSQTKIEELFF